MTRETSAPAARRVTATAHHLPLTSSLPLGLPPSPKTRRKTGLQKSLTRRTTSQAASPKKRPAEGVEGRLARNEEGEEDDAELWERHETEEQAAMERLSGEFFFSFNVRYTSSVVH